jgi:hypothetical protein
MSDPLRVTITPTSAKYDDQDDRWRDQVADLVHTLRVHTDDALTIEKHAVPGTKGAVSELILALGTSGMVTASIEVIRMWLARDRTRTVDVSYTTASGEQRRLTFTAQNATGDMADPLMGAVATQMSGGAT